MSETQQPLAFHVNSDAWTAKQQLPTETSQVSYTCGGHVLALCDRLDDVYPYLDRMQENGVTVVVLDSAVGGIEKQLLDSGTAVFTVPSLVVTGHLGSYFAHAVDTTRELDLAVSVFRETGAFDLVLDVKASPSIDVTLKPFGYVHRTDADDLAGDIDELLALTGDFDKPKYFDYSASVCAHSRSQLSGCTRCMDVCTTGAIQTDGEGVKVDPYLCQGCGTCATVCPSGAMTYAYPRPKTAIKKSRELLAEANASTVLLYSEKHQAQMDELHLEDDVFGLLVEETTAYGLDYWLSLLAGHIQKIIVLVSCDEVELIALRQQQAIAHELLAGLGVTESVVHLLPVEALSQWQSLPVPSQVLATVPASSYDTHNDKRQTVRLALDALAEALMPTLSEPVSETPLPIGASFGRIAVNQDACTLCMACVSTCPAKALQDGQDTPALKLIEANCVQCGLCEQACPESAISLQPQYLWDSVSAREVKTLHEDSPFHCISCHTPFATKGVIANMASRLGSHWMFQDDAALRRLKMCGDCRVKDIFRQDAAGIETHREER